MTVRMRLLEAEGLPPTAQHFEKLRTALVEQLAEGGEMRRSVLPDTGENLPDLLRAMRHLGARPAAHARKDGVDGGELSAQLAGAGVGQRAMRGRRQVRKGPLQLLRCRPAVTRDEPVQ